MSAGQRFAYNFVFLIGFTLGVALTAGTNWPWWTYIVAVGACLIAVLARVIYDIRADAARESKP
jgi:hypothetical protein